MEGEESLTVCLTRNPTRSGLYLIDASEKAMEISVQKKTCLMPVDHRTLSLNGNDASKYVSEATIRVFLAERPVLRSQHANFRRNPGGVHAAVQRRV